MSPSGQDLRAPYLERPITLLEMDYSRLMGDAGNPVYVRYFTPSLDRNAQPIVFDGNTYVPAPVRLSGFDRKTEGTPARPTIEVPNGSIVTQVLQELQPVGGDLTGAKLRRRRVWRQHLDGEPEADVTREWGPPEAWMVEGVLRENPLLLEIELSAPSDVQNFRLPARTVENNLCLVEYKGAECGWVPGAGPYFDADGNPTSAGSDDCGLHLSDCSKRFKARGEPLRIHAFPGAGRTVG